MEFTIVSVFVFGSITTCLVLLLNVAEKKLLPQGDVSILINDEPDKAISVGTGGTLLGALSGRKVFLPSACGGGGTCAMCKLQVFEGAGDVLPTELPHLSLGERKENVRLGCQVKVKNDIKIKIPDEMLLPLYDDLNTPGYISNLHKLFDNANKGNDKDKKIFVSACNFIGILNETKNDWINFKKKILSFRKLYS